MQLHLVVVSHLLEVLLDLLHALGIGGLALLQPLKLLLELLAALLVFLALHLLLVSFLIIVLYVA